MGDIPLISQYYSFKNKDGSKMMQQQQDYIQSDAMKKQAQVAQSMLIRESKSGKRQNSGISGNTSNKESSKYQKGMNNNLSQER